MNRQLLESLYYKDRKLDQRLLQLADRNPEFLHKDPLAPEFILQENLKFDPCSQLSQTTLELSQSLAESLSIASTVSHFDSIKALYKEAFLKRQLHSVFSSFETEEQSLKWFYEDEKSGKVYGPLGTPEMDQRFRWGILKEKSKVRSINEMDFREMSDVVKEYVEELVNRKAKCELSSLLSARRSNDNINQENFMKRKDAFEPCERRNREERVLSNIVRPNITALTACIRDNGDFDDEEEVCERGRARASTLQVYPNIF